MEAVMNEGLLYYIAINLLGKLFMGVGGSILLAGTSTLQTGLIWAGAFGLIWGAVMVRHNRSEMIREITCMQAKLNDHQAAEQARKE
jgi:hypothetical protein